MTTDFEDFIDTLQFEPLYVDTEVDVDTICGYTDTGDLLCETLTVNEVVPTDVDSSSEDDVKVSELINSLFQPFYDAFSTLSGFNPYNYVFYQNQGAEDDCGNHVAEDAIIEVSGFDFYEDDDGAIIKVDLNFTEAADFFNDFNNIVAALDDDTENLDAADLSVEEYFQNNVDFDDEFAAGETIEWHQQVFQGFVFLIFLLSLAKFVQLHKRARALRTSDRNAPLLTVAIEKEETTKAGETGSYVPPRSDLKKSADAEKEDTEPYIIFI